MSSNRTVDGGTTACVLQQAVPNALQRDEPGLVEAPCGRSPLAAASALVALPLFNDGGSILMTGSNASLGAFPGWSVCAGSKAVQQAWARVWLNELKGRRIRVNVLPPATTTTSTAA